ncbi:molybdotransferase-like divisome protein Glp [Mobilicoccus caccae]|uniref:Molybdopterin molybdenumtransferase n=1 Tax=Mobilicoccus caccae TaxID=1859295 RepID=A0ABQ6IVT8_9MICO|nr:gephyrin-like molybdotransferase Glp [Mobilicoccus caccae]GMA40803.1 molybdopterin molybdenumtransferase MoeA [Mobilicoccus caccae]
MIGVHEHLARILSTVRVAAPTRRALDGAQGCVLAEDLRSRVSLPGFDNSAMDGYAVLASDVERAGNPYPTRLPVEGDIAAGDTTRRRLRPGTTFRIMTGAPVPEGADAVVPVEQTDAGVERVTIHEGVPHGRHIRPQGEDVGEGQIVLRAGTRLGPRQLALAAAVGHGDALVIPLPRVVVVSTGDELIDPGQVPGFGQVVDSNGPMLAAAARDLGVVASRVGGVADDPETVSRVLRQQLARADAIVTTGGVSMGAYDAVKAVLSELGTVQFDRVAMQPGKPQGFGTLGEDSVPVFTLPGNPVSSLVSFEVFVAPALRRMAGRPAFESAPVVARAEQGWTSPSSKTQFARVVVTSSDSEPLRVRLAGGQGSHVLGSLADAHGLAIVAPEVTEVKPGDEVLVLGLDGTTPGDHAVAATAGEASGMPWFGATAVAAAGSPS